MSGPYKGSFLTPPVGAQGPEFVMRPKRHGKTVSGRFSSKYPEIREQRPHTIKHVTLPSPLLDVDYSQIERRVMAQLAGLRDDWVHQMWADAYGERPTFKPLMNVVNLWLLHGHDKALCHHYCYAGSGVVQERIDEEGCGALMAAARALA